MYQKTWKDHQTNPNNFKIRIFLRPDLRFIIIINKVYLPHNP